MFSLKNKLSQDLKISMDRKIYKTYKVVIHCRNMSDKIYKKVVSYKCQAIKHIPSINCVCATLRPNLIERLIEYPQVDFITFDDYALLCGVSVQAANKFHIQHNSKFTGKGITLGLIDSGVFPHMDLLNPENKLLGFVDMLFGLKYPYDDYGHGTFISGLISGSGICSNGMYRGMAEDCKLYIIKAFNQCGKGYISDILFSLELLINQSEEYNIKVICLPFELANNNYFFIDLFSKLFDLAISKNIVIVAPAGNNCHGDDSLVGISTLKNCISVGGADTRGNKIKLSSMSSYSTNNKINFDLSAACEDICSLRCNTSYISEHNGVKLYPSRLENPYTNFSGTSCSAAFVAAVCTLYFEKNPALNFNDIKALLKLSCKIHHFNDSDLDVAMLDINDTFA